LSSPADFYINKVGFSTLTYCPVFGVHYKLCKRHNVVPLEFNGREDSLFQAYSLDNQKFMEYVEYHESYSDIPVDLIVAAWRKTYGEERVNSWIAAFESGKSTRLRDFNREDVVRN
jgi:hypothetical protein